MHCIVIDVSLHLYCYSCEDGFSEECRYGSPLFPPTISCLHTHTSHAEQVFVGEVFRIVNVINLRRQLHSVYRYIVAKCTRVFTNFPNTKQLWAAKMYFALQFRIGVLRMITGIFDCETDGLLCSVSYNYSRWLEPQCFETVFFFWQANIDESVFSLSNVIWLLGINWALLFIIGC